MERTSAWRRSFAVALFLFVPFPSPLWAEPPCPGEVTITAFLMSPLPPPEWWGNINFLSYGPLGPSPGSGPAGWVAYPGGSVSPCVSGQPGEYQIQATPHYGTHLTVSGGSIHCTVEGCNGAASLILPPIWVKPNIRGGRHNRQTPPHRHLRGRDVPWMR